MHNDIPLRVKGVSKKFCKDLRRTMLYGIQDIAKNMIGLPVRTENLRRAEFWSLDGISFDLRRGECLGLIGPNGAGKSTLLKILNGIMCPDGGRVEVKGRVGALIEVGAGFHPMLTGRENIYINGSILGFSKKEIDKKFDAIVAFSELSDFIDTPVKFYSSGMYVRLGFSIVAQMEPDVMLIDEVLAVGDIGFKSKCFNAIDRISKNAAVVFVSHQMPQIARICSDVMVINHGKAVHQGRDVPKGLEVYYSQFQNRIASVSGSGKASIRDIRLSSNNSRESANGLFKVDYLDDFYIRLSFSVAGDIGKAIVNISFFDRDMRGAAQCYSNNCNFEIINTVDVISLRIKIPQLQFNPGIYSISIVIVDERRGETLVHHHAIKDFRVVGPFVGFAPVQLQGEWEYV
ncbi:MAG: ABC transporter ATP-binding protein [Thermodesulfobacteriota bacterium]|nr:ABC transporter ATP-binding protein [Thermodesulfobacteriota bacterium]